MQIAYCDKNLFYWICWFIIEKLDFLVKMPGEKEVLWIYSFGQEWNIFILPFLDTLVRPLDNTGSKYWISNTNTGFKK